MLKGILFVAMSMAFQMLSAQGKYADKSNNHDLEPSNNIVSVLQKPHFVFHFLKKDLDTVAYYKAAYYYGSGFNQFRYYDKRRVILLDEGVGYIELFSVKELLQLYHKVVKVYVKPEEEGKLDVRMQLNNGFFKPQKTN